MALIHTIALGIAYILGILIPYVSRLEQGTLAVANFSTVHFPINVLPWFAPTQGVQWALLGKDIRLLCWILRSPQMSALNHT
jgi:hypothetical protein